MGSSGKVDPLSAWRTPRGEFSAGCSGKDPNAGTKPMYWLPWYVSGLLRWTEIIEGA